MPHQPSAPRGVRFFGRIDQFHCECPACGSLIVARLEGKLGRQQVALAKRADRRSTQYNPITSVLNCPRCRLSFGVGLIAWPLRQGGNRTRVPADHQPTRRQLRQLAQYGSYGIWANESKLQGDDLNVALDQECTCPQLEGGWAPACPVHGWAQDEADQAAIDVERALVETDKPEPEGE